MEQWGQHEDTLIIAENRGKKLIDSWKEPGADGHRARSPYHK